MRWLILSHILQKSKTEIDSTFHIFKRTTFWLSTFSWKIQKTSTTLNHITSYIHHKNRLRELIDVKFFKNCISEMSNFGKVILFSPMDLAMFMKRVLNYWTSIFNGFFWEIGPVSTMGYEIWVPKLFERDCSCDGIFKKYGGIFRSIQNALKVMFDIVIINRSL